MTYLDYASPKLRDLTPKPKPTKLFNPELFILGFAVGYVIVLLTFALLI